MLEELWLIRGNNPVLFTIPFKAIWRHLHKAELHCCVNLYPTHRVAVEQLLRSAGGIRNVQTDRWYIKRSGLKAIGGKVESSIMPETLFSWEKARVAKLPRFKPELRKDRDEFLDELYQQNSTGLSREHLEIVYYHLCNHMLDWMINKERCVDLYFIELWPSPYKINWREYLHKHRVWINGMSDRLVIKYPTPKKLKSHPVVKRLLRKGAFISVNRRQKTVEKTVEVFHKKNWWTTMREVEGKRLALLNPEHYAQTILNFVERRADATNKMLSDYLIHRAHPIACFVPCDENSGGLFVKESELFKNGYARVRIVPAVTNNLTKPETRQKKIPKPNVAMPTVPDLQQETQNVRDSGGDVQQSENRKA